MPSTPSRDDHASGDSARIPAANLKRRRFLMALGAGTAGSAAVAAQAITPIAADVAAPQAEPGRGYQETQHVRDYYATARI